MQLAIALERCDTGGVLSPSLKISPEDVGVIFLKAGSEDVRLVLVIGILQSLTSVTLETVEHIPVFRSS